MSLVISTYATAASIRFVFLTWIDTLINCVLDGSSETPSPFAKPLIACQASLIDGLVDSPKKSIAHGSISDVRRSLRKVLS